MGWLDGEVVLVTGGGSGLGAALVRRCLDEGAQVAVLELMAHKVDRLNTEYGSKILVVHGDVTSVKDVTACRDAIVQRFGRLSALIGTQGVWDGNVHLQEMDLDTLDAAFAEMFNVNVKGFLLTARVFADLLAAERGSITMTLSNAAYSTDGGGPLYTATKHAVVGLVRQLAFELAPLVRVNGVAPCGIAGSDLRGPSSLGQGDQSQADRPQDTFAASLKQLLPLQTYATAQDYTSLYVLLASGRHSGVMTGQVVVADQGLAIRGLSAPPAEMRYDATEVGAQR